MSIIREMATGTVSPREPRAFSLYEDFDQPFVLSSKALHKIHEILVSRSPGAVFFQVAYSDGSEVPRMSLEQLLRDENPKRRSITNIQCIYRSNANTNAEADRVSLKFSSSLFETAVSVAVTSPDRERIWLTVEELRDYLRHEVMRRSLVPRWAKLFLTFCVTAVCIAGLVLWGNHLAFSSYPTPGHLVALSDAVKSTDPNVKLNYLLQEHFSDNGMPLSIVLSMLVVAVLGAGTLLQLCFYNAVLPVFAFPIFHFAIGGGLERHKKQERLRENLVWGVWAALAVSIVAGLIVWVLSAKLS